MSESIYLAGPMRGIPHFNFPAFETARNELRKVGFKVFCPAERDLDEGFDPVARNLTGNEDLSKEGFDLRDALGHDMAFICREADGIATLPGWKNSRGATAEVALAEALNLRVDSVWDWLGRGNPAPTDVHDSGEVRVVDPDTGGAKGVKLEDHSLIPVGALKQLATLYGKAPLVKGYDRNNWRRGYTWSSSYAAAQRHLTSFWEGEYTDPEMGVAHLICAAFHCFALVTFHDEQIGTDDRWVSITSTEQPSPQ